MQIKTGVALSGMSPEIVLAVMIIKDILNDHGQEVVITSGVDGKHRVSSAHYTGRAVDLRIWDLKDKDRCITKMRAALGRDYDVVLESNHIHLEFDPKMGANL
jgi:hypothetical protein